MAVGLEEVGLRKHDIDYCKIQNKQRITLGKTETIQINYISSQDKNGFLSIKAMGKNQKEKARHM